MSTYLHNGKWLTEVRINKTTSISRLATADEIPKTQKVEQPEIEETEVKRSPGRPKKDN